MGPHVWYVPAISSVVRLWSINSVRGLLLNVTNQVHFFHVVNEKLVTMVYRM